MMPSKLLNILLVEDSESDAALLQEHIRLSNFDDFHLDFAVSLQEAIDHFQSNSIDAALLDLTLPDSSGLETVRRIKQAGPDMPIVVLTGIDDENMGVEALRLGAQDYLVKGRADGQLIARAIRYAIERKRAEKALRQSEEKYRNIVETATEAIIILNARARIVFVNNRWPEMFGYSREEALHMTYFDLLFPEDMARQKERWEYRQSGKKERYETRLRRKDGSPVWALVGITPNFGPEGEFLGALKMLTDITKLKHAEEALQKAHNGLEKKVEDRTFQLLQVNEQLKLEIEEHRKSAENLRNALDEIKELKDRLEAEREYLQEEIKSEYNFENIIGNSKTLRYALYKVEQIAPTDTAVLILGETGTGKELIARAIHGSGPRRHRAFVKVNCATLPSNLMESELFGHEKGAFSGAVAKRLGRFEVADGATLFLDEIGELPLALQTKLLSVLQDGEFERVGSSQTVKVDVRIIAATNRDLEAEVRNCRFRQDLWFRLNVFPITMPPLRSRREDIPMLVEFFVEKVSKRLGRSIDYIPKSVMDTLQKYHWPGNIRELQNVVERAVINASGNKLRLMDKLEPSKKDVPKIPKTMEKVEYDHIVRILEETRWKVAGKNGAAQILGLNPSTLRARMRKLGIKKPKTTHF